MKPWNIACLGTYNDFAHLCRILHLISYRGVATGAYGTTLRHVGHRLSDCERLAGIIWDDILVLWDGVDEGLLREAKLQVLTTKGRQ